jgi:hypothetical protein
MNDAGYHESSIALWQALIEFLLFRPQSMDQSEALTSFEEYWDSEVPRVGEVDWVTWPTYHEKNDAPLPHSVTLYGEPLKSGPNLFKRFAEEERQLQKDLQFPGRTIDDAAEDDPFHVVLFSDLEPVLSTLCLIPNAQSIVVVGFLCYCGLPPLQAGGFEKDSCKWWLDPFIKHHGYDSWNDESTSHTSNLKSSFPASWRYSKSMTGDLFSNAMDIELCGGKNWVSNILKVFIQRFPEHDNLCEYYIAFRLKQFGPS